MKTLTNILFYVAMIGLACGVVFLVCNGDRLTSKYTDCMPTTNYGAITALFTGIGFIAALITLYQQKLVFQNSQKSELNTLRTNERNQIYTQITSLYARLNDINRLYIEQHNKSSDESDGFEERYSEHLFNKFAEIYNKFSISFNSKLPKDVQDLSKAIAVYSIQYYTQQFLEIIYPLRQIYRQIDNSEILNDNDKSMLAEQAFTIFNHHDIKLINLLFINKSMSINDDSAHKYYDIYFGRYGNSKAIEQLNPDIAPAIREVFMDLIENAPQYANDFSSIYADVRRQLKAKGERVTFSIQATSTNPGTVSLVV